jgi:Ca2+/H+ antiporter
VGFAVAALVGAAAAMASALAGARKDRFDLSVGIALRNSAQVALFVALVLVLLSYVIGPAPMKRPRARQCVIANREGEVLKDQSGPTFEAPQPRPLVGQLNRE